MASFNLFGFQFGNESQNPNDKNAERIQDFVNNYKITSRDLSVKKTKEEGTEWQGYSWVTESTSTSDDRSLRYNDYKQMIKTPELNMGLNIYCLHPDTIINTIEGDFSIKELSEKYTSEEIFEVWSYNLKENRLDIGKAKNPHKTLINADVYKVTFDDGREIIATKNHPFLLKSGIYKKLEDLIVGDHVQALKSNHTVVSVEYQGKSDVYDLEVEQFHNFSANEIIVHNSDNSTQSNIQGNVLEILSDSPKVVEILNELFFDRIDVNANLWSYTKNMCKLGDQFVEVIPDNKKSPRHVIALDKIKTPEKMFRIENKTGLLRFEWVDKDEKDKQDLVDSTQTEKKSFQPWQIVHFRIEDDEFDPYGRSIFEAGRKVFKRLSLMEDAMLIYRISRAPERRVFYIDVGTLSTKDANKYIDEIKTKFRKKSYVNPHTGEIDQKANPLCITMDTKIPLLDGRELTLKSLIEEYKTGKQNWVYSIDVDNKNQIVPGKIEWAGETIKNASLVEVVLDNDKKIRCTPDHKFLMRDGFYVEAQNLKRDDSLMTHLISQCKVISVKFLDYTEDTGCLTIEKYHNFAISDGVIIKNSSDEDFYIAVRAESQGTRIETLPGGCLTLDTKIKSLDGNSYMLSEMIEKYKSGKEQWVYSCDPITGEFAPGIVSWAGITHHDAKIMELTLDNGEKVRCTPDHKFPVWGKGKTEAKDLSVNDSIVSHTMKDTDKIERRVVSIKYLDNVEDVGTLTIDKEEKYHNYHTFALDCGIYTFNSNLGEVDDVKYFRDQILKTLGIPSAYLGGGAEGGAVYDPKSFLSQQDVQFARTIERLQKFIVKGLEKIAIIELIFNNIDEDDIKSFKIKLTAPSNVDQLMKLEVRNQQFTLIQQMKGIENFLPDDWIYKNVLGFNDKEINKIKLQLQMQMQMAAQLAAGGAPSSGGGGGGGGSFGGNISPPTAGGPPGGGEAPEAPAAPEGGEAPAAPEGGGGEAPAGGGELQVASRDTVEFDGGKWLFENTNDAKKLIKYINLYEKVHKDNNEQQKEHNSSTRMVIEGEFRGLIKAKLGSDRNIHIITEKKKH